VSTIRTINRIGKASKPVTKQRKARNHKFPNTRVTSKENSAIYSSKVIKSGALLDDTLTLLNIWDTSVSNKSNVSRISELNMLGKASRSRLSDILSIFIQRYAYEKRIVKSIKKLIENDVDRDVILKILYYHTAISDRLVNDIISNFLFYKKSSGIIDVYVHEIEFTILKWNDEGKMPSKWGDITIKRAAQSTMAILRDFGVFEGAVKKRFSPFFLPLKTFAYVAFLVKEKQPSGMKLLDSDVWKLFFLDRQLVERYLLEADHQGLLDYHVAGNVTRLVFPVETLEEYVDVLVG